MGKLDRVVCTAVALIALGCSGKRVRDPDAVLQSTRAAPTPQAAEPLRPGDGRFDAHGKLKSSGQRFSWLELPAGFTKQPGSTETTGVWETSQLPTAKLTEYLEARIAPSNVDIRPGGVTYRKAKPTHTQLPMPPVTVTVIELNEKTHAVRLLIDDLTPPRDPPLPERAAAQELARERSRME